MTDEHREDEGGIGEVIEAPADGDPIYRPAPNELQLTIRAVVVGCVLGALVSAMNIYFGLRTGWGIGGSLIAAILSYAAFATFRPSRAFTPLETNIAQTSGSAAGSMSSTAGLIACIPALTMLGYDFSYIELTLWVASVAWLGVFYAVPLRRQMVLSEKLRFPTGTATANTIVAMFGSGAETVRKAKALLIWAVIAGLYTIGAYFIPDMESPPLAKWAPMIFAVPASFTFSLMVSPLLWGAGILVGMRVSLSLVGGAIVAWALLVPFVESQGWVSSSRMSYATGARGWILWPGVAIMVADALTNLALSWRSIVGTFKMKLGDDDEGALEDPAQAIPNKWWIGGLTIASILTIVTVWLVFDISPILTLIAIVMSSVLAAIATRSTGETDINPIGGMGKVTQLVYGGLAPGQMDTNLLAAGVTGAGASQAADMMQDLKTGHLLGASPRKQLIAQLAGIASGVLLCVPIYRLQTDAYTLGSDKLPAPAAMAWKALAEVLAKGFEALPTNAAWGVLGGLIVGIAVPLLRRKSKRARAVLPVGIAFGIAFIIPAFYSLCFLFGAVGYAIWRKLNRPAAEALGFAVASGLIAGEGLMGLVTAAMKLAGVEPLIPPTH